jgi:hypothetical protein
MKHFLLTYSLTAGKVIDLREFDDASVASAAYGEAERKNAGDSDFEIVLVGADSQETLRTTHGHYFDDAGTESTSPYLAGV